jgi:hypothetical protein
MVPSAAPQDSGHSCQQSHTTPRIKLFSAEDEAEDSSIRKAKVATNITNLFQVVLGRASSWTIISTIGNQVWGKQ